MLWYQDALLNALLNCITGFQFRFLKSCKPRNFNQTKQMILDQPGGLYASSLSSDHQLKSLLNKGLIDGKSQSFSNMIADREIINFC